MKKVLVLLVSLIMVFALSGCGEETTKVDYVKQRLDEKMENREEFYTKQVVDSLISEAIREYNNEKRAEEFATLELVKWNTAIEYTLKEEFNETQYYEVTYEIYRGAVTVTEISACIEVCEVTEPGTLYENEDLFLEWYESQIVVYEGLIE